MRRFISPLPMTVTAIMMAVLSIVASAPAQQRQALPNHLGAPASARRISALPSAQRLNVALSLPMRNPQQLQALVQQLKDPTSAQYGRYLTVSQFTQQFGPTVADYDKVLAYATSHGLSVTRTYRNRTLVNVSGPVAALNQIFHVTLGLYQHPTEDRKFYAPDLEPTIESGFPILSVHGLTDFDLPHSMLKRASTEEAVHSNQTGSGQDGQFLGSDMRAAYAPGVALDGTGQSVGLIELGPYNLSDVQAYFAAVGQPLNVPIDNVLLGVDGVCSGTPSNGGCDDGEEVIDIEQAISMAPHLSALIVYEAYGSDSDALTAFTQAANDDVAKQLSLSFGWGGTPATEPGYEQIFMELAAQGQNTFVASGDGGASVGTVGYPGNSPNITDAGGTDLTTSGPGGSWLSETGWVGSGGGWNTESPIPGYQVPAINSTNQGSGSYRNIPDVAMEANTDNFFCANGSCSGGIGGTSLAAPRWAGFLSLVNQQANGHPVGFLNSSVYSIGQSSAYATVFHDITTGNNFNDSSPSLFTANSGYDLVTGWGSPNGEAMIGALAPITTGEPNFILSASPATVDLKPGGSGATTITVSPTNSFDAEVELAVSLIGAPMGVSASLSPSSVKGSGSSILSVSTTGATPPGNTVIAVTGTTGGITQTAYITLALPDFTLAASPTAIYLDQQSYTISTVNVTPENGFAGKVALSLPDGFPEGVIGFTLPQRTSSESTLVIAAGGKAVTGAGSPISVVGSSGSISHALSSMSLAVSAAKGRCGSGTPVNLASAFNLEAIYSDGRTFPGGGGLDADGSAYSANVLSDARVLDDIQYFFGAANVKDAVYAAGQTISLPAGQYETLHLLGTGIDGNQASQAITVTYVDGTTSTFIQGFSDWFSPNLNVDEGEAVAMPYRNTYMGTKDTRAFNLYGYTLLLDHAKKVKSFTLPNNRAVVILAATLAREDLGTQANLAKAFNATGVYSDGTTFAADGGIDTGGAAYSANLLGDSIGPSSVVVHDLKFNLAEGNRPNVVYGTGQQISLPAGRFTELHLLGTGLQGDQTAQQIVVRYTDGSSSKFTQSFSDWFTPQGFPHESQAVLMPYRDFFDGSQDDQNFNLYEYDFQLDGFKTVKSVELPQNRFVVVLGMTLTHDDNPLEWVSICGLSPFNSLQ
jgi:hypothetical protein